MERVDKVILEQLSASLDARASLYHPSVSDHVTAFVGKCLTLPSFVSESVSTND